MLDHPMAGPSPQFTCGTFDAMPTRRITKDGKLSNPVFTEFHRILWCGYIFSRRLVQPSVFYLKPIIDT